MKGSIIEGKSFQFSLAIIELYKLLVEKREYVLSKQPLRSGTSIGANVYEARGAISRSDFSAKLAIFYKESLESKYWLELLVQAGFINEDVFDPLFEKCDELGRLMYSALRKTG
ncbi:MAG: four helix bundle protein [Bacteroidetes bacterium]|nr:four helix bundle protein [Bacteroidota bacterium]